MAYQLVSSPNLAAPGKCACCGYGGRDRIFVDFNLDVEFYGVVYICELCMQSAFDALHFSERLQRSEEIASLVNRIKELEDERNDLLGALRVVDSVRGGSAVSDEKTAVVSVGAESNYTVTHTSRSKS